MAVPFPVPAGRSPAEDLVSWLSAGKRYLQCNPDIFLRDLRRHASGIHEKHGDYFLPGVCNPDGGCADLCGTVYDGP